MMETKKLDSSKEPFQLMYDQRSQRQKIVLIYADLRCSKKLTDCMKWLFSLPRARLNGTCASYRVGEHPLLRNPLPVVTDYPFAPLTLSTWVSSAPPFFKAGNPCPKSRTP